MGSQQQRAMFSNIVLSLPSLDLFQLPPSQDPLTLLPPTPGSTTSAPPFEIPAALYHGALDIRVPVTIACVYAAVAMAITRYNTSTGGKPWAISKTRAFFVFVVLHNVFLAVYSGWTFIGMLSALQNSVQSLSTQEGGLALTVDSLCKIHGTPGLGNAITYQPTTSLWVSQSPSTLPLNTSGNPSSTDPGRFWNEGLAFYGWIFYMSKFYEVLDTLIILAKGKKSSTLQTYHHAGAMLCMWAGIRFMSPPIWLFVFLNSLIHTMMYTYYTITCFSIPFPQALKQTLTTLQITQFLIGTSYAAIHSFVSYTIPVEVPYLENITKNLTPEASTITTTTSTTAAALATAAGLGEALKKFLFRAAGEEGLAANLVGRAQRSAQAAQSAMNLPDNITTYRTEYHTVPCVETSGQTFAIWLNVLYLTPLTVLFVRFFIRSYIKRSNAMAKSGSAMRKLEKSAGDALHGADRELNGNANGNGHAKGYKHGTA